MLVHRNALALKEGLGDDYREELHYLRVNRGFSESCDGKILFRLKNRGEQKNDYPNVWNGIKSRQKECFLSKETINSIQKQMPKKTNTLPILDNFAIGSPEETSIFGVSIQKDTKLHCITADFENKKVTEQSNPDTNYPNTDSVFPEDKPAYQIGLSIELLEKLVKVTKKIRGRNGENLLKFSFQKSNLSAVRIDYDNRAGDKLITILVPMQLSDEERRA